MDVDPYVPASAQIDALRKGETTAQALLERQIERFRSINARLNAIVKTDIPRAQDQARALDQRAARGEFAGPLHGLPMTVKDTFDVDGLPAIAGAPEYANRSPNVDDAAMVARLKAAGAVIWGKTNTPYLAGDAQTFNDVYGVTNNPFDASRTPGGSSGGAAAALAAGLTPLEIGSDIGGSLRTPAHFCGVCALKPSYGRLSQSGHAPPAPGTFGVRDLNVVGPMARNVADLKRLFTVMDGRPDIEPPAQPASLEGRRIGLWSDEAPYPLSVDCAAAADNAAKAAARIGAITTKARPDFDAAELLDVYMQLLLATLSDDLPRGVFRTMEAVRPIARLFAGPNVFTRAKWVLYCTARHADWIRADEARQNIKRRVGRFFDSFDALITPVSPIPAFPHVHDGDALKRTLEMDGGRIPYGSLLSWVALATACHLPAAVIPTGQTAQGLPVGVQIIGAEGEDDKVLDIAHALEQALGGFTPPVRYAS